MRYRPAGDHRFRGPEGCSRPAENRDDAGKRCDVIPLGLRAASSVRSQLLIFPAFCRKGSPQAEEFFRSRLQRILRFAHTRRSRGDLYGRPRTGVRIVPRAAARAAPTESLKCGRRGNLYGRPCGDVQTGVFWADTQGRPCGEMRKWPGGRTKMRYRRRMYGFPPCKSPKPVVS